MHTISKVIILETIFKNSRYTYEIMQMDIEALKELYPFIEIISIGKSVLGNDLTAIRIGNGLKEVFYSASFHANEWITSPILIKFIAEYCLAISNNSTIFGYNAKELFNTTSLYVVPMVNPDGVNLVTGVISQSSPIYNAVTQISSSYPSIPFLSGWKANIRGVDLNLQFPARLGKCKRNKICPRFYISCTA